MAEDDRVDYPEPPKAEHGKPAPQCPYCCEVLESSDLSQPAWKYASVVPVKDENHTNLDYLGAM